MVNKVFMYIKQPYKISDWCKINYYKIKIRQPLFIVQALKNMLLF